MSRLSKLYQTMERGCVIIPDYVQPLFCVYTAINLIMPSFFQTYPGISPVYACNK